jgi:hypothetical protein
MSFLSHYSTPVINDKGSSEELPILPFVHQSYCWQVALQHCLLPLQIDNGILNTLFEKITNHFSVHYRVTLLFKTVKEGELKKCKLES